MGFIMKKMKIKDNEVVTSAVSDMTTAAAKDLGVSDLSGKILAFNKKLKAEIEKKQSGLSVAVMSPTDKRKLALLMLDDKEADINPLVVLRMKFLIALKEFGETEGEEQDVAIFKKAFNVAERQCVNHYKATGNSSAADYITAACLTLLGVIVGIIGSPVLLFSSKQRDNLVNTFFSGPETKESKALKGQMVDEFAGSLLEEVTPAG